MENKDGWRLRYHLMPPDGWLNDPNGLCQHNGIYHVFFQYAPNTPAPDGRMARTWGHYAGPDLTDLAFEGVPFWPEEPDHDGCYSGSALIDGGTIRLYYTGNIKEPGEHDYIHTGRLSNTILVETDDGKTYGEKRVLLRTEDYPEECTRHVRDPKVWREDGKWYMVLGARLQDDTGAVLLYESADGISWTYVRTIASDEPLGYMWECPDYFELDGQGYLSWCPQGVPSEKARFQNLHSSGYAAIDGILTDSPVLHDYYEWDCGFDFYAQQTFADESGRRLMYIWVGMPDKPYDNPTNKRGWENALTVPRELIADGDRIRQRPAAELEQLRGDMITSEEDGTYHLPDASGDVLVSFPEGTREWNIRIGNGVRLCFADGILELSLDEETGCGRTVRRAGAESISDLRILVDTSLLEIFVNDGAFTMTTRYYPEEVDRGGGIDFSLSGADAQILIWEMRAMHCNEKYFN